jgi:hypothetical protein
MKKLKSYYGNKSFLKKKKVASTLESSHSKTMKEQGVWYNRFDATPVP